MRLSERADTSLDTVPMCRMAHIRLAGWLAVPAGSLPAYSRRLAVAELLAGMFSVYVLAGCRHCGRLFT